MSTFKPSDGQNKLDLVSADLFRSAVEKATAGVAITDTSGQIIFINETYAGYYGYKVEELRGQNISIFYRESEGAVTKERVEIIRATGVWEGELKGVRKDGSDIDIYLRANTLTDPSGKTIALVGFTHDITEQNKSALALRQYKQAFDSTVLGLALVAPDRKITYANPALTKMTGYQPEELVGMDPYQLQVDEAPEVREERTKKTRESIGKIGYIFEEITGRTKAGKTFPATLYICSVQDDGNKPLGFIGIFEDVSEQKKLRKELDRKYQEYELLFENAYDAIFTYDVQGNVLMVNKQCERIAGYTESELRKLNIFDLVIPEEHEILKGRVEEIFSGKKLDPFEYTIKTKDGKFRKIEVGCSVINYDSGIDHVLAIARDVTEYKEKERKLLEQANEIEQARQDWEIAFNTISDALFIANEDRVIIKVNSSMYDMLEVRPEDIIGKKCHEVFCLDDGIFAHCPAREHCSSQPIEHIVVSDTKLNKIFDYSVFPFRPAQSENHHILHTIADITEQSRLREALVQTEKLNSLGELVAGIAHEINNPLAAVSGYTQLLLGEVQDEGVLESIRKIEINANRAAAIIKNLMQFARKQDRVMRSCDINDIVDNVVKMKYYSLFVSDIKLEADYERDLPKIIADPIQLQQVMLNIINNSEQAITSIRPFGTIEVYTRREDGYVKIVVSDNGCGMDPNVARRIFDPFFTTKGIGVGTGLGLSVAYGIVKDHGGNIEVKSDIGLGSTFTISLPVELIGAATVEPGAEVDTTKVSLKGKNILVIDDETILQDLVKRALEKEGAIVTVAGNGIEAIERLSKDEFHGIFADIKMPGLDGKGLFDLLESNFPQYVEKVAFLTGDAISPETSEFLKRSKRPYLLKPFNLEDLINLIKRIIK